MKVGDYVRYKYENCIYIGKIKFISEVMGCEETLQLDIDDCMEEILKEDIIKSRPNIIDLVEVGDILTIRDIFGNLSKVEVDENFKLLSGKIVSIVTKESFERMEYKVNEND